jgi:hypothetical protein
MRRIWRRLFAARPMAGPPTDYSAHTELLTMYALTRRKVLSQAEEIERLKAER